MSSLYTYIPLLFALYMFTKHLFNKLRNLPPSPILNLPILGHLYLLRKPIHRCLAKISDSYGPILLLQFGSRRVLVVSSPSAAEECLNKNDIIFANRPSITASSDNTSLASVTYGGHWRILRKLSSMEMLSTHRLQMLQDIRFDEVKAMIKRLYRISETKQAVDMKIMFFELIAIVMMRMIAGKRYYCENVVEVEEAKKIREITIEVSRIIGASNMEYYLPVLKLLGVGGAKKKPMILQFLQELVEECKGSANGGSNNLDNSGTNKTMIEVLLTLQEKEPEYYTDGIIRSLMLVLLTAGTETSAATMEWALSLLLNNPEVLKKAQTEIDNLVGDERLLEESDIINLPYLRCIINETMRMYPPAPLLVPHQSSEECFVGGYRIPRGTMLLVNLWAIQNDPKIWMDPRKFKPERFEGLGGTRDGFKLMPYGFGRRGCPGETLASRIVGLALGSVIQCFDWEKVGKEMVDMTEGTGISLSKGRPVMAKCCPRPIATKLFSP
ncbi:unnamed protein product [Fraxinus pennsylvanica]|uniref:Flavonoid-6-hydroxylase n=1 Tax=Fraxinus pennsylvanica TaxID=56036 RepID=A0AAD1ZTG4_9LAMI|nr:unnamed protein product [Fraxinus pennsylvanica]